MIGCNPSCVSFLMRDDDTIRQRIQVILLAEHRKQLHRCLIGFLHTCPCSLKIRTVKCGTSRIPNAGRLTHLYSNVRVISASLCSRATMPPSMIPRKCLVHGSIISINKTMHTGTSKGCLIPAINKNGCPRLRTPYTVKHQSFYRNLSPCGITGILCHNRLN